MTYIPGSSSGPVSWSSISGIPSTFTPATHSHTESDVTGLTASLAAKAASSAVSSLSSTVSTLQVMQTVEVNLGSTPRNSGRFTIAGSGLTPGKPVMIEQASGPYTGKGTLADEAEMDRVKVNAIVTGASTITAHWGTTRRVRGNFKFNYMVGV